MTLRSGGELELLATFDYNPASQVIYRFRSNDLYAITGQVSRTGAYVPNGLNQYTEVGDKDIGYDANGNLTTYLDANDQLVTYVYDMENHLVSANGTVNGQSVNANFTWDPLGRLHQVTINGVARQFLHDGDALVAEYNSSGLVRRYVHGDQVDEPLLQYDGANVGASYRRYLHADHQGSVIAQSGSAGSVLSVNAYDPYGIPASTNSGRFGYTGQAWLPELGLYHYKARMYHPRLGRFLQTDPIFYADDMNMYAYAGNDPFNRRDSSGRSSHETYTTRWRSITKGEFTGEWYIVTPASGHRVVWPAGRPEPGIDPSSNDASQAMRFIVEPVEKGTEEESPDSAIKSIDALGRIVDFDVETRTENASNFDGPVPNEGGTMNDENEDGSPAIPLPVSDQIEASKGEKPVDPDFIKPPPPVTLPEPRLPL